MCLLKSLEDQGKVSEKEKNDLYPSGVLYGLAKIHKALEDGITSILSAIGTPTSKLAKFYDQSLNPRTSKKHAINDSFSYAKEVLASDASLHMASFGIKSLFTNIV